ncbi:hypothetical protein [Pararhizobium sp. LjRoot238]|uniref:hypothetical protein n=1 Tax=Pararhizobium sp. LjRoot238 TaxID=3342293 RepID=UPI003ECEE69C
MRSLRGCSHALTALEWWARGPAFHIEDECCELRQRRGLTQRDRSFESKRWFDRYSAPARCSANSGPKGLRSENAACVTGAAYAQHRKYRIVPAHRSHSMKDELSPLPGGRQIIFQHLVAHYVNVKTTVSAIGHLGRKERGEINESVQLHFTIAQFRC